MKVRFYGYFAKNLGDDLFFKIALEKYPDVDFYLDTNYGYFPEFMFSYTNLHYLPTTRFFNSLVFLPFNINNYQIFCIANFIAKGMTKCFRRDFHCRFDAYLELVGSRFMVFTTKKDENTVSIDLNNSVVENKQYKLFENKTPKFLLGTNVGPLYSESYLVKYKNTFCEYDDVCFIDKASYNLYSFLPNVRYAPDLVFNLDTDKYSVKKEKQIIISIINLSLKTQFYNYTDFYCKKIAEIASEYADLGYTVKLTSFCKVEKDEVTINEIFKYIDKSYRKKVKRMFYNGKNMELILNEIAASEYIIAGRFHAMILAMLFGKPFLPICYNDKMYNYLNDIHFDGVIASVNHIDLDFEIIDKNRKENKTVDITNQLENAADQFKKFDEYINRFEKSD